MVTDNTPKIDTSGVQSTVSLTNNGHACIREGYPILLLRKSAINRAWLPAPFIDPPPPQLEGREPAEPLQDHHNILRVLREGYVYVLAGTASKKDYINCYEVLEGGILREKLPEDSEVDGKAPFPTRCLADNHYVPASFITVDISENTLKEKPFLWIAYSRYAWNKTTRDYYKNGQDLARFSKVDLASLIQSPTNHPRCVPLTYMIGTKNPLDNILEFMPYVSDKVQCLPNYKSWSKQTEHFTRFVQQRERKYKKPVGAIVLEDVLGMAEELNFQRLAEVNYTGDVKLHNKVDIKTGNIPYEYSELHTPQGQYKKLNYDLIEQYKVGTKQYFDQNSKDGFVYVSSIENMRRVFSGEKWQYGGRGKVFEETGSVMYSLSQPEKAHYDFDQYWEKLNAQLKIDEYNRFAEVVKRYEKVQKNNGRDYTLYCRWLFCNKLPASEFFSGSKRMLESNKQIIFPKQTISNYNTVNFWQREYDYNNRATHNDILGDAIAIFRTRGTSYYDMGLWDELLSSDTTYFQQVVAGNNPSFWHESDTKAVADKVDEIYNLLISECISNPVITLANAQNIIPEVTDKHLVKITNASGVQKNLTAAGHSNAKIRTITFRINTNKVGSLANNKNIAISPVEEIANTKQTNITLTLFCDDDGFKNIEAYVKRTNQGNRAANDINKLSAVINHNVSITTNMGTNNAGLVTGKFKITLPEDRFKQLEATLKQTHGENFTGFTQVTNKGGMITAQFQGSGTPEKIVQLRGYLRKYASSSTQNRYATVKTLLHKINHIEIAITANSLSEASQEMGKVMRESGPTTAIADAAHHPGSVSVKNIGQIKPQGAHTAVSASILFELLLLAWQAKLLRDNSKKLDELGLKPEERNEILSGIVLASVSITINTVKVLTESVKKLADLAGNVESKMMVTITNKAATLSEKVVMKALIGTISKINFIAKLWGSLEGIKEIYFGLSKIAIGFRAAGVWQTLAGVSLLASMWTAASGWGIVLSIVLVLFSVFCTYMSGVTSLTVMEQWFDRCYFGQNELNGNLAPYPLTEESAKKLVYGFYSASRGYAAFLTKKSQHSTLGFDTGSQYDIYLNVIVPNYQPETINYTAFLTIERLPGNVNTTGSYELIKEKIDMTGQTHSSRYTLDEQGTLIIHDSVFAVDDNTDKKVKLLSYIEENSGDDSFTIELDDYIDI